jgi:membrane protease YdiL (CAAX protease family)
MGRLAIGWGLRMLQPPAVYLLGLVALALAGPLEGVVGDAFARLLTVIAFNAILVFALAIRLPITASFCGLLVASVVGGLVAAPALIDATEIRAVGAAAGLVIVAVAWEELLFRGLAFDFTRTRYGTAGAIALSSLTFAGAHLLDPAAATPLAIAYLLVGGVLLGLVRAYYESIWPAFALHAAHNLVLACIVDEGPPLGSLGVAGAAAVAFGWWLHQRGEAGPSTPVTR